jgi:uncharacterized MAPEG superfamily protein
MTAYPALPVLVLAFAALLFKSTLLSAVQVVSRARARTFLVAEDARLMRTTVTDREAPFVVRCGNVWRNDLENIPFFLIAALTFALMGGTAEAAAWWFGGFVVVRYLHTAIYLRGLQPARTIAYLTGLALTWGLVVSSLTLAF